MWRFYLGRGDGERQAGGGGGSGGEVEGGLKEDADRKEKDG